MNKPLQGLLHFLGSFGVFFLNILLHSLKVLFNITFMATAFTVVVPSIAQFYEIKMALIGAAKAVYIAVSPLVAAFNGIFKVVNIFSAIFSSIDLPYLWRKETVCAGGILWMQFFAAVIFIVVLGIVMTTDIMYVIGITSYGVKKRFRLRPVQVLVEKLLDAVIKLVFYILQVIAFVGMQMLFDGASSKQDITPCSDSDEGAMIAARAFVIILLIVIAIPGLVLFGGGFGLFKGEWNQGHRGKLTQLLILIGMSIKHTSCLILGIWDPENMRVYKIRERAEQYDDDPTDDDPREETACSITAKTQSLFWVIFPGTVFIAKIAELMNDSIIFGRLRWSEPFWKRLKNWILNVLEVIQIFLLLFVPSVGVAISLLAAILLRHVVDLGFGIYTAFKIFVGSETSKVFEQAKALNPTRATVQLSDLSTDQTDPTKTF